MSLPHPSDYPLGALVSDPDTGKVYVLKETEATTWGGGPYMSEQRNNDGGKPYWFDTSRGGFWLRRKARKFLSKQRAIA